MGAWIRKILDLEIGLYGANICFFLVLSLFPGLVLVLYILGHTAFNAMDLIDLLQTLVPEALMPAVERLVVNTWYNSAGAVVPVSAAAALWSASRGVYGLVTGLNRVYGVRENRGYFRTRILSMLWSLVLMAVLAGTLVIHVFGGALVDALEHSPGFWHTVVDFRQILLTVTQTGVFALVYTVLPNRAGRFSASLPGAAGAAVGWQIFARAFSIYVRGSSRYLTIYGPVYLMALGMLWLYCCGVILLTGGAVNRLLEKSKPQEKFS